jgi:DNA-binding PadR family transcriptional regulator
MLSTSEILILGILAEEPRHGYDIEKLITDRGMRKWADIGFSSIYYLLDKLESKGYVTSSESQGKERKQFSITLRGTSTLKTETAKLIVQRKPANAHLMAGLATSLMLDADEYINALSERQSTLTDDLNALIVKSAAMKHAPLSARRLFGISEALLKAELDWIKSEIERSES